MCGRAEVSVVAAVREAAGEEHAGGRGKGRPERLGVGLLWVVRVHQLDGDGQISPAGRVHEAAQALLSLLWGGVRAAAVGGEEDNAGLVRPARQLKNALEHRAVLDERAARDDKRARLAQPLGPLILRVQRRKTAFARRPPHALHRLPPVLGFLGQGAAAGEQRHGDEHREAVAWPRHGSACRRRSSWRTAVARAAHAAAGTVRRSV